MRAERKKEIRSLQKKIPELIKSHLVDSAFALEKVIASTWEFTDSFSELMANIPQNYIETVQKVYSDLLHKAWKGGQRVAEEKSKSLDMTKVDLQSENFPNYITTHIPMLFSLKQSLKKSFREEIDRLLESVPDNQEIYLQFSKDLDTAHKEGVKEFLEYLQESEIEDEQNATELESLTEEKEEINQLEEEESDEEMIEEEESEEEMIEDDSDDDEVDEEEDEANLIGAEDMIEDMDEKKLNISKSKYKGRPMRAKASVNVGSKKAYSTFIAKGTKELKELYRLQKECGEAQANLDLVKDFYNWVEAGRSVDTFIPGESKVKADAEIGALEAYTKIPGTPEAEKVLRYELGLPPTQKATASKSRARRRILAEQVGPYDTHALKNKILQAASAHTLDNNDLQTIIIDCLVSDVENYDETALAKMLADRMSLDLLPDEKQDLSTVEAKIDMIAETLDQAFNLPGDTVFLDINGDYCLTYNFDRSQAPALNRASESLITAKKKVKHGGNPQGVLTRLDQKEIENLAALGKSKTMKDIKRASGKMSAYMRNVLSDLRAGKVGISEGCRKLRANMEDMISEVFGPDGLGYFQYVQTKK